MKNKTKNIQVLIPVNSLARVWRKVITIVKVGFVSALLIVTLIHIQPNTAVAAGGCEAPDGECSTVINS